MAHYYTNNSDLISNKNIIKINLLNQDLVFNTDNGVFSKSKIDFGSKLLIDNIDLEDIKGDFLDVGCGYGTIGITIAKKTNQKVTMIDVNDRAILLANENIKLNKINGEAFISNVYENITCKYSAIITNPPIRAGKSVVYKILFDASNYLLNDGVLYLVIRKEQGAKSVIKDLQEVYNTEIVNKDKGFFILRCAKRA